MENAAPPVLRKKKKEDQDEGGPASEASQRQGGVPGKAPTSFLLTGSHVAHTPGPSTGKTSKDIKTQRS